MRSIEFTRPGLLLLIGIAGWLLSLGEAFAQIQNGFSAPQPGDVLSGIVLVEGTAADANFLRYEVAFQNAARAQSDWIVFAQGDQQVFENTLAVWDTTVGGEANPVFPDGPYRLRLRVVRTDYNYDEFFVSDLLVSNYTPTPTPTGTLTVTLEAQGTALPAGTVAATPLGGGVLPTLTPFPTPSPLATLAEVALGPSAQEDQDGSADQSGLLGQFQQIDTGSMGRAFLLGIRIVIILFALLALYLLGRGILRRMRRILQKNRL